MISMLILLVLSAFSCSQINLETRWQQEHRNYLTYIEHHKTTLSSEDYKSFITREIKEKERSLIHLKNYRDESRKQLSFHEAAIDHQAPNDIPSFKVQSGGIEQKRLSSRIGIIEREIFFLRGQL